jgi:hypothetical protein
VCASSTIRLLGSAIVTHTPSISPSPKTARRVDVTVLSYSCSSHYTVYTGYFSTAKLALTTSAPSAQIVMASNPMNRAVHRPVKTCTQCKQVKVYDGAHYIVFSNSLNIVLTRFSYDAIPRTDSRPLAPGVTPGTYSVSLIRRFDERQHASMFIHYSFF